MHRDFFVCRSCRGRACPARNLTPYPFHGQSVGEGFIPPGHLPAAVNGHGGQRAGRPTTPLKNPCAGENPAPTAGRRGRRPLQSLPQTRRLSSHPAPPLFLHILYKLYRSHTKPGTSLQKLYRDCTAPWSIPARKCGTMALLPVKHCEMHKLYPINLVKRESTHT